MRLFNAVLIPLFCTIFLSSCFLTCVAQKSRSSIVGVKPGDYVKYIGSIPQSEYEWLLVSVLNVKETEVNISISYELRPTHRPISAQQYKRSQIINVATGEGNIFLFLIPANLTVGDAIPQTSSSFYPSLAIEGIDFRKYAGVERTVVYASSSNMPLDWGGALYWDKETGVLVEIVAEVGSVSFSSLRLIETNIWSINLMEFITHNSPFLTSVMTGMALLIIISVTFVRRKKMTKGNIDEIQATWKPREDAKTPLMQTLEFFCYLLRLHAGEISMGVGVLLFGIGIMNLTNYDQVVYSSSFVFAVIFFVLGVLVRSEAWIGNRFKINVGVIMICLSVIIFAIVFVCATYREIGAMVPYRAIGSFGPHQHTVAETLTIEVVYLYPYSQFASSLVLIALCLAMYGVIFRMYYE